MGTFTWTFSTLAGSLLLGSFLWVLLWHWVRKKNVWQWFPLLKLFPVHKARFLQVRFQIPPLVPVICFMALWVLLVLSSMEPSWVRSSSSPLTQGKAVVYVDLTPSVSSVVSLSRYQEQLKKIHNVAKGYAKVIWLTSWDQKEHEFQTIDEFDAWISTLTFQRTGRKIGSVFQTHTALLRDVQSLFIVSDRDLHSWREFHWRYYGESMDVRHIFVGSSEKRLQNYYFESITSIPSLSSTSLEWEVVIKSTDVSRQEVKRLQVFQNELLLQEKDWKIDPITLQTKLHVSIPIRSIDRKKSTSLRWVLHVDDGIESDNEFRTPIQLSYQKALLVVKNEGEHFLSTSRSQLRAWLEVLGFEVDLVETISQKNPSTAYSLAMILLHPEADMQAQCPTGDSLRGAKVWLLPYREQQELDGLCWCYNRFLTNHAEKKPVFCSNLYQPSELNRALFALGAEQVGGSVNSEAKSIAYVGKSDDREILVFTRSFSRNPTASILSGRIPFLIQSLLEWQHVLTPSRGKTSNGEWARLEDVSGQDSLDSNVPIGESRMEQISKEMLPPEFDVSHPSEAILTMEKEKNAIPWVWLATCLLLLIFSLEVSWFFLKRKKISMDSASVSLVSMLFWMFHSIPLLANPVQLSLLNTEGWKPVFQDLSRTIASKTSIEISPAPKLYSVLQPTIYSEPWIWVKKHTSIQDSTGALPEEMEEWVRSGGLLILENAPDLLQLQKLTKHFESNSPYPVGWNPVEMDHELMRSFYLLHSLPNCHEQKIMVFSFDKRMSILAIPFSLLEALQDQGKSPICIATGGDRDSLLQVMINVVMVALTTDYKKDQLHMKEVLKRLQ